MTNRFSFISKLGMAFIGILSLAQCTKEINIDNSYNLPVATQTGTALFACHLTGIGPANSPAESNFIADNNTNDPLYSTTGNGAWYSNDTVTIVGAPQIGSYFKGITIMLIGNLQEGNTYTIDSVSTIATAATSYTCAGIPLFGITTSIADSGTVQLTRFDKTAKIISGNFTCNFTFPQCDSTVYATDGRFDYTYH